MTRAHALALAGLFVAYVAVAAVLPPADDELYYWCWQERGLQLSYYDHPPMTAVLIRASVAVFGDSLVAVRLPACAATAFVFGVILFLTRPPRLAWWLLLTPPFTLGAVLVTPDTPLLLFWAAYLAWLVKVHERLDAGATLPVWLWVLGGVVFGGGVLGKYTTALAGVAGFVGFLVAGKARRWLPGFVLHGVVAFAVASPILIHNIRHDFAPLAYQWQHSMGRPNPGLKPFGEFVGVQILLFGTMPLALLPWVVVHARRLAADARLRVCACLFALPYTFFLYKATRGPLEGNWALACYIAFWPLAADWYERVRHRAAWRWSIPASFAVPALVVLAAAVHLIHPLDVLPPRHDRVTRQAVKSNVADRLKEAIDARGERLPVYAASYQMTALLRFHGIDARQMDGATRPSHFTQRPEKLADAPRAYLVWEGVPKPAETAPSQLVEVIASIPIDVRGEVLAYYTLLLYTSPQRTTAGR